MWIAIMILVIVIVAIVAYIKNKNDATYPDSMTKKQKKSIEIQYNLNTSGNNKNTSYDYSGITHMDMCYDDAIALNQFYAKQCYECIDNFWSWTKDDDLYTQFKSYETQIKAFNEKHLVGAASPMPHEQIEIMNTFAVLQGFAYSYYLVLNLNLLFSSYDIDSVTLALVEVFNENGFLGEESFESASPIDDMIAEQSVIVRKTIQKLS